MQWFSTDDCWRPIEVLKHRLYSGDPAVEIYLPTVFVVVIFTYYLPFITKIAINDVIINFSRIVVSLNVNHTVDSAEPDDGTQEAPEMKSKPNFEVDIIKPDGKTLSFSCSYIVEHDEQGSQEEGFGPLHSELSEVVVEI